MAITFPDNLFDLVPLFISPTGGVALTVTVSTPSPPIPKIRVTNSAFFPPIFSPLLFNITFNSATFKASSPCFVVGTAPVL